MNCSRHKARYRVTCSASLPPFRVFGLYTYPALALANLAHNAAVFSFRANSLHRRCCKPTAHCNKSRNLVYLLDSAGCTNVGPLFDTNVGPWPWPILPVSFTLRCLAMRVVVLDCCSLAIDCDSENIQKNRKNSFPECEAANLWRPCSAEHSHHFSIVYYCVLYA